MPIRRPTAPRMTLAEGKATFLRDHAHVNMRDRDAVYWHWSLFVEDLHRRGKITDRQMNAWDLPDQLGLPPEPRPRRAPRKNPCGCSAPQCRNPRRARKRRP